MKVFELINALACFQGHEDVYLDTESFDLLVGGAPACVLPEGAPEVVVKFSSHAAFDAARDRDLADADFAGHEATGSKGFTVSDVKAVAEAKADQVDAEEATATEAEVEKGD